LRRLLEEFSCPAQENPCASQRLPPCITDAPRAGRRLKGMGPRNSRCPGHAAGPQGHRGEQTRARAALEPGILAEAGVIRHASHHVQRCPEPAAGSAGPAGQPMSGLTKWKCCDAADVTLQGILKSSDLEKRSRPEEVDLEQPIPGRLPARDPYARQPKPIPLAHGTASACWPESGLLFASPPGPARPPRPPPPESRDTHGGPQV
jgi:hypothetical protein